MRSRKLVAALVAVLLALGALSFVAYRNATATNAADPQLRASAGVLLRALARPAPWSHDGGIQDVLDSNAGLLGSRHQFAVVCWDSAVSRSLVPNCVHQSSWSDEGVLMDAAGIGSSDLSRPRYATVSVRSYAAALDLPKEVAKDSIRGSVEVFQASGPGT